MITPTVIVLSLVFDAICAVVLGWLIYWAYKLYKTKMAQRSEKRAPSVRHRFFLERTQPLFVSLSGQDRPAIAEPMGIAPLPPKSFGLPRRDPLDFGVIEPWNVSVDVEHAGLQVRGETIRL